MSKRFGKLIPLHYLYSRYIRKRFGKFKPVRGNRYGCKG